MATPLASVAPATPPFSPTSETGIDLIELGNLLASQGQFLGHSDLLPCFVCVANIRAAGGDVAANLARYYAQFHRNTYALSDWSHARCDQHLSQ